MQTSEEKRFIDRNDFRIRKDNQIYCPYVPPKDTFGTSKLFMENTGKGLDEVLLVQYQLLLLNGNEEGSSPCKYSSKINELSGLSEEEIFNTVCKSCNHYNLGKKRVELVVPEI